MSELLASYDKELDRVLQRERELHDPELIEGSIAGMEPGDGGWVVYWAVDVDTAGRYWLGPLNRLDPEPHGSVSTYVRRTDEGYVVDFRAALGYCDMKPYDTLTLVEAEDVDRSQAEQPSWVPVADVIGFFPVSDFVI